MPKSKEGLVSRTLTKTHITKYADRSKIWLSGDEITIIDVYPYKRDHIVQDDGDVAEIASRMCVVTNGAQLQEITEDDLFSEVEWMLWSLDPHFYTRPEYEDAMAWRGGDTATTETDWADHKPTEAEFQATDQQAADFYEAQADEWDTICRERAEDEAAERYMEEERFRSN